MAPRDQLSILFSHASPKIRSIFVPFKNEKRDSILGGRPLSRERTVDRVARRIFDEIRRNFEESMDMVLADSQYEACSLKEKFLKGMEIFSARLQESELLQSVRESLNIKSIETVLLQTFADVENSENQERKQSYR